MKLPDIKVVPQITEAKVSKKGFLNKEDLQKIWKNFLVWHIPIIVLYAGQLTLALNNNKVLSLTDLVPGVAVIGAWEAHLIGTVLDYLKKLNNGTE